MKKIILTLILASIATTSFGMDVKVDYQNSNSSLALYATIGGIMGGTFLGLAGLGVYSQHLASQPTSSISNETRKTSWTPYLKITTGLGFAGLSAYLGLKGASQPISYTHKNESMFLSPTLILAQSSAASLAPLVPAYFFMKSGFEDLRMEKKALLKLAKKKQN